MQYKKLSKKKASVYFYFSDKFVLNMNTCFMY